MLNRVLATLFGLSPLGMVAHADEGLFFSELPVLSSASRLPQRQADSATAMTVIDKAMIKAMGARDLNDLLRIVPGFQTFTRNTHSPRVTYHGIPDEDQSSRIQVLVDGRSLFSPLFDGGVNWSILPVALENIERIEVIRGSNAASYGGNAFQAQVNIITIDPSLTHGTTLITQRGNQGVDDSLIRHGGKLGESGDFRLTYQQRRDDGIRDRATWQDAFESKSLDWRSDFTVNSQNSLQFTVSHVATTMLDGRIDAADNPMHDVDGSSTAVQALWQRQDSAAGEAQVRYAYAEDHASNRYDGRLGKTAFVFDPQGSKAWRHELEVLFRQAPSESLRTVWGASYRWEAVRSPLYFNDNVQHSRSVARLFGHLEWKPSDWLTGNLALAAEEDSLAGVLPAGRSSLNLHLTPEHTLRVGAFQSERAGSIMEYQGGLYVQVGNRNYVLRRGNPELGSERFSGFDLGYLGRWPDQGLQLDVRGFAEHIPNRWYVFERVYADCVSRATTCFYNAVSGNSYDALRSTFPVQDVHVHGVEYSASWTPLPSTRFVLSQSFTRTKADYLSDILNNPANKTLWASTNSGKNVNFDQLTEQAAPRRATALLWMQKLPYGLDFSAFAQWTGKMKWTTNTTVNHSHRADVRLGYPFRWQKKSGEIALTVQSINGPHGEFIWQIDPSDRIVERRSWLTLRLDL